MTVLLPQHQRNTCSNKAIIITIIAVVAVKMNFISVVNGSIQLPQISLNSKLLLRNFQCSLDY